jgi:hypothetical protein
VNTAKADHDAAVSAVSTSDAALASAELAQRGVSLSLPRAWLVILGVGVGSRLAVFALAALVQLTGFPRATWHPSFAKHPFALLEIWDGRWYRAVAEHGYLLLPGRQSDPAFFPLLPVLMRSLHTVGFSYGLAGVLISTLAFLVGLVALYELACTWLPEPDARRTAVFAAIFPVGVVFSMAYPEALAFALISLTALFAIRGHWLACALCVALATLARPEGLLVALPIAGVLANRWPTMTTATRGRACAAILAPAAVLIAYSGYLHWVLGDGLAWTHAEAAWGRSFNPGGIYHALLGLEPGVRHQDFWFYKDGAFCLVYLGLLALAWRAGIPRTWIVAGVAMVLLPLTSGSFNSDARFGILALPVYAGLAIAGRRPVLSRAIPALAVSLLAAGVLTLPLHWP